MIGFCTSPRFVEHDTGPHHPERPDRIRAIHKAVRDAGLVTSRSPFPEFTLNMGVRPVDVPMPALLELDPAPATDEHLRLIHTDTMIENVRHVCAVGGGILDLGDTPVCRHSYEIALLSLGGALRCCDAVMRGEVTRAFSAGRPPGHHAEPDRSMGFCLFSNIAVAARYVQRTYGVERVAIVDFDVHHGNGTQACFEADPSVLFVSLHQHPATCYPRTGYAWEIGVGPGRGYTLNIPFEPGKEDDDWLTAIDEKVVPALDDFRPQLLMISAGFDAHYDDPLADMRLSDDGYERMTRKLVEVANAHCGGRVVSLLEGGYNLKALGRSVVRHLVGLM
jgi:acetoin utilization deacetylase AcuC-like enzyme